MAENLETVYRPILEAAAFAARAHCGQLRKDRKTPYVSHVFRVSLVLQQVFGIQDRSAIMAALLHDTLEDTTTDFDDLEDQFGKEVARWVAALSKDKRLPEDEREAAYVEQLKRSPWQVKVCKLADIFDNLMDSAHSSQEQRARVFKNSHRYLDALRIDLPEPGRRPWEIVLGLLQVMESKDGGRAGGA